MLTDFLIFLLLKLYCGVLIRGTRTSEEFNEIAGREFGLHALEYFSILFFQETICCEKSEENHMLDTEQNF